MTAILALAFALRAIMAVRTSVMFEDGPHFLAVAKLFANGDWAEALSHPYHPLYSGLIAAFELLIHDWEVAALSVSVIGGTAAVLALYLFLRDAFDSRSAIFGAFLMAISPYAVRFTSDIESEGVYLAFFMAAVALLWRGLGRGIERGSASILVAAGVSAGFAYLARPEGAGLVLIGIGLLILKGYSDGWRISRITGICFALAGGALMIAAPYLRVLMQQRGGFALSGKKSVFRTLGLSGESANPLVTDPASLPLFVFVFVALIAVIIFSILRRRNSDRPQTQSRTRVWVAVGSSLLVGWLLLWPGGLREFASVLVSTLRPEVSILVALGIYASISASSQRESQPRDVFIAAILAFYAVVLLGLLANYGYLSRRHVLPLIPLLLGYAGLGAGWLVDRVVDVGNRDDKREETRSGRVAWMTPVGVLTGLALAMFAITAPKVLRDHREDVLAQRLAAEWLRDQAYEPGGRVASDKRRTAYYAERQWFPLTKGSGLRSLESLVRERVRYIVADDRDQLLPSPGIELRELYRAAAGGRSGVVYELTRSISVESRPAGPAIGAGPPKYELH